MKEQSFRKYQKVKFDLQGQLVPFDVLRHNCLILYCQIGSKLKEIPWKKIPKQIQHMIKKNKS